MVGWGSFSRDRLQELRDIKKSGLFFLSVLGLASLTALRLSCSCIRSRSSKKNIVRDAI